MVQALDNIVTEEPLRDIRLSIGPAEALLQESGRPETLMASEILSAAEPSHEAQLAEAEARGMTRGREEAAAEYQAQVDSLRQQLTEAERNATTGLLQQIETNLQNRMQEQLGVLEKELVEFAAEAAIRLVNGLPISTQIVEAAIRDALAHCENDAEVSVRLHPEDLKMLKESGSELLADSPHQRFVRYLKDDEISRGGCLVETRCGVIDGRRETREDLLREAVQA